MPGNFVVGQVVRVKRGKDKGNSMAAYTGALAVFCGYGSEYADWNGGWYLWLRSCGLTRGQNNGGYYPVEFEAAEAKDLGLLDAHDLAKVASINAGQRWKAIKAEQDLDKAIALRRIALID